MFSKVVGALRFVVVRILVYKMRQGCMYRTIAVGCTCFESRLRILGISKEVNKTRFKEQVLEYFANAQEQGDGKNAVLVFEKGM